MIDRLNYFSPYQNKKSGHEDHLTRAFLVVLKYSPLAQSVFFDLVREYQNDNNLDYLLPSYSSIPEKIGLETQVSKIEPLGDIIHSIVFTNEPSDESINNVCFSDRSAIYDAIIYCPPDRILIVENKPSSKNIWKEQLNVSKKSIPEEEIHNITLPDKGIMIYWKDLIKRFAMLLKRSACQGTESQLIEDFLDFVEHIHPKLSPYERLSLCKDDPYLLKKRCHAILESIAPEKIEESSGTKFIVLDNGTAKLILLKPKLDDNNNWSIYLSLWPGDTVSQARKFYNKVDKKSFLDLQNRNWSIKPNMHFAFMNSNLVHTTSNLDVEDYFNFWHANRKLIKQESSDTSGNFESLWQDLLKHNIITNDDIKNLEDNFDNTKRKNVNICPGFKLQHKWTKDDASKLDDEDEFVNTVKQKIEEAMQTWKQFL